MLVQQKFPETSAICNISDYRNQTLKKSNPTINTVQVIFIFRKLLFQSYIAIFEHELGV